MTSLARRTALRLPGNPARNGWLTRTVIAGLTSSMTIVASCTSSPSVPPQHKRVEACGLSTSEVRSVVQQDVLDGRSPAGDSSLCAWMSPRPSSGFLGVQVRIEIRRDFDAYAAEVGNLSGRQTARKLGGIGDDALVVALDSTRRLFVKSGPDTFSVLINLAGDPQQNIAWEKQIALLLLARI